MRLFFEKDVETVRTAYQQLSDQVNRFTFVRFILLFILAISFARAFELINTAEIGKRQAAITDLESKIKNLNERLNQPQAPTQPGEEGRHEPSERSAVRPYAPEGAAQAVVSAEGVEGEGKAVGTAEDEARKKTPSPRQEIERLQTEVAANTEKIEEIYRQAFRVKIPFVGGDPMIDLRSWIYALPFLFILSEVYLYILRKQLGLLSRIAAYRVRQMKSEGISTFDRLLFSNEPDSAPPFAQHPAQLFRVLYLPVHLALAVYIVATGKPFWKSWDPGALIAIIPILLTATYYAIAYSLHVSRQLETQVEAAVGLSPTPRRLCTVLENAQGRARALAARLKPGFSLTTGSLLIGMTLFLSFSMDSCAGTHRGYDLARGWAYESAYNPMEDKHEYLGDENLERAVWRKRKVYLPDLFLLTDQVGLPNFGRAVYVGSLLLAGLTLSLLVAARYRPSLLKKMRLHTWVYGVALTFSLFIVSDFALTIYCGFSSDLDLSSSFTMSPSKKPTTFDMRVPVWYLLLSIYWLVPVALWARFTLARREETRARWPARRTLLIALYAPLVVVAVIWTVIASIELIGVPFYFIGLHLLTFGYRQLANRL